VGAASAVSAAAVGTLSNSANKTTFSQTVISSVTTSAAAMSKAVADSMVTNDDKRNYATTLVAATNNLGKPLFSDAIKAAVAGGVTASDPTDAVLIGSAVAGD